MKTTEYSLFKRPGGAISGNNPYYEVRWSGNILGRVFRGENDFRYWYGRIDDMIVTRSRTREGAIHKIMNLTTTVNRKGQRHLQPLSMVPGGPSVAPRGHEILTEHTYCPACSGHGTDRHECVKSTVTVDRADLNRILEFVPFSMMNGEDREMVTRMWNKIDD